MRELIEIRAVLLHPPKVANPGSLARDWIGFVNDIPRRQVRNDVLVVLLQLAFQFQQLSPTEKVLNPQESILFECQFAVRKVHDSVSHEKLFPLLAQGGEQGEVPGGCGRLTAP